VPDCHFQLQAQAARWLARLPFLGAEELSLLLGVSEPQAARVLAELERGGRTEWVWARSPELEPGRLYLLSRGSRFPGLSECLADRGELLRRLTRLEAVVGLNRFAAELVAAVRNDAEVELEDLRWLPSRRPAGSWWPPYVEGYGCLRRGRWRAPFFLAWDRAGAPPFQRRTRVGAWYAFREGAHPWRRDDVPPVLVVCPGEAEAGQWARAVLAASDRRQAPLLPVALADVPAALGEGPLGPVWRRPDGSVRAGLCERLVWRPAGPPQGEAISAENATEQLDTVSASGPALREWAREAVASSEETSRAESRLERLAALSLVTGPVEKRALEWLGHHPLLSADDLAAVLGVSRQLAVRVVHHLARYGLVQSTDKALKHEVAPPRRYYLTDLGLKLLAARDGVPPRRYARYGLVAAPAPGEKKGGGRLGTLLRQFDHTVGANGFFVRMFRDGGRGGPRLIRWLSASEAARRFSYGGLTHWLRPDGAGDIYHNGTMRRFYLEWDRGTVKLPDMVRKLRSYAAYYAFLARTGVAERNRPAALLVTSSPARESVLWRTVLAACEEVESSPSPFFSTVDALIECLGPLGAAWRTPESHGRVRWYDSA
jgi:DNA-binding MarR family transcriptional regulator